MTPPSSAAAPAVHPRRPASPARRSAPPRPRRVSGPPRRGLDARPPSSARRSAELQAGIAVGVLGALKGLSRHALLDRLLRGRTWIALVTFALIGIVTLQLGLLKLNASIGRTLVKEAALQRENAALNIENSELSAGGRVESRASQLGMELVPTGALRFLAVRHGTDASRGASALSTPPQSSARGAETSTSSASGASSSAPESPASQTGGESTSTPASGASSSGEGSSSSAGEASAPSGESTASAAGASAPAASAPPSPAPATQSEPAAASSAEAATPAGGTQSGPAG
jgi:cell division protein FtsL